MMISVTFLIAFCNFLTFSQSEMISTTTGAISGRTINVLGKDVDEYLGIPYAKPPLGELRFKPPVPVEQWKGVLNATKNPPSCMQVRYFNNTQGPLSEDCLFINIWVPKNRIDAVMVYFHGGGFVFGSINKAYADGSIMSSVGGVIFVSVSYRLGPFGFLYSGNDDARGNMGMKDQVLGLRWIKDNVKAFGGNPSKITIFGRGAGAISVSTHLVSPLTKGLFKSAIMQSGSSYNPLFAVRPSHLIKTRSEKLAKFLGCTIKDEDISADPNVMSCMRNQCASSILLAEAEVMFNTLYSEENPFSAFFTPIYGDDYLPDHPIHVISAGRIHVESFMIGTTRDEGSLFLSMFADPLLIHFDDPETTRWRAASYISTLFRGLKYSENITNYYLASTSLNSSSLLKQAYDSVGDFAIDCPSVFLSDFSAANGVNVYYYTFDYVGSRRRATSKKWQGVAHGQETPFLLGLSFTEFYGNTYTCSEKEFSKEMIRILASFAKEGKPSYSRLLPSEWPRYGNTSKWAVQLRAHGVTIRNPYKEACNFWRRYLWI